MFVSDSLHFRITHMFKVLVVLFLKPVERSLARAKLFSILFMADQLMDQPFKALQ